VACALTMKGDLHARSAAYAFLQKLCALQHNLKLDRIEIMDTKYENLSPHPARPSFFGLPLTSFCGHDWGRHFGAGCYLELVSAFSLPHGWQN
jgi:hypothetical protein